MKKLLLVNPGADSFASLCEPLNLAFLATFVQRNGYDVDIVDPLSGQDVLARVDSFKPDLVGFTATTQMLNEAAALAKICKEKKIPTVVGGPHPSTLPESCSGKFDYIVVGEGEHPLLSILKDEHEPGIIYSSKPINLDDYPFPARHLLNNPYYLASRQRFPHYFHWNWIPPHEHVVHAIITRGCKWNCAFCHNIWRTLPYRILSPENAVAHLEFLKREYNIKYVLFMDDNIFSNREKARNILRAVIDAGLGLNWSACSRTDTIDEETIALAKKAGCRQLIFGMESGSQRLLDDAQKRNKVENSLLAASLCHKHGINVHGSFMVGHPKETWDDVRKTRILLRKLKLTSIVTPMATPYPGTKWWSYAQEQGLLPKEIDWSQFQPKNVSIKLTPYLTVRDLKWVRLSYYLTAIFASYTFFWYNLRALFLNPKAIIKRLSGLLGISEQ